jgi:hypothetical protein
MGGPAAASTSGGAEAGPTVDDLAARLRDAGVLPDDVPPDELRRLAQEVASEMRASASSLSGLGGESSGKRAVEDSIWLERLTRPGGLRTGSAEFFLGTGERESSRSVDLLSLFTRKVKDKVFVLRKGLWTQHDLPAEDEADERVVVEAFSRAWFDLLEAQPALRPYFAFSTRLVVALDGVVYEVRPPAPKPDEAGEETASEGVSDPASDARSSGELAPGPGSRP